MEHGHHGQKTTLTLRSSSRCLYTHRQHPQRPTQRPTQRHAAYRRSRARSSQYTAFDTRESHHPPSHRQRWSSTTRWTLSILVRHSALQPEYGQFSEHSIAAVLSPSSSCASPPVHFSAKRPSGLLSLDGSCKRPSEPTLEDIARIDSPQAEFRRK